MLSTFLSNWGLVHGIRHNTVQMRICIGNSDISNFLYVISPAVRWVKFETILKNHEWYLHQISCYYCLYYYLQKVVIFTCRYFKLSWNTSALSQSNCRSFSCSSIRVWNIALLHQYLSTIININLFVGDFWPFLFIIPCRETKWETRRPNQVFSEQSWFSRAWKWQTGTFWYLGTSSMSETTQFVKGKTVHSL